MDTTRLEQLISDAEHLDMGDMAADGVTVFMVWQKEMREAIAALQPGGEREELAKWCEDTAALVRETSTTYSGWLPETAKERIANFERTAALLRTLVVVDDAMVERAKDSFHLPLTFDEISKYGTLEARIRRALNAALGGK